MFSFFDRPKKKKAQLKQKIDEARKNADEWQRLCETALEQREAADKEKKNALKSIEDARIARINNPIIIPDGYTLPEWRANKELPKMVEKVFAEPAMSHAFAVLYNQIPTGFPLRGQPVNDVQAAIELGRMNGYIECLSLLRSLAYAPEDSVEVEQDYGADKADNWS